MTTSLIQRCDLLGRLVIDQRTTEEIGTIAQLLVDSKTHKIIQVKCKSGFLGRTHRYFEWADINSIGNDSILVNNHSDAVLEVPDSASPVIGLELWSDAGSKAGGVTNYCLNPETGDVIDYVFVSGGWKGIQEGTYRLPHNALISVGRKRIIAQDEVLQSAEQFSAGLQDRLTQALEFIKEDYAQTQADMTALVGGAQASVNTVQESVQQLATKAQTVATDAQGHLQSAVHKAAEQVQETAVMVQDKVAATSPDEPPAPDVSIDRSPVTKLQP